MKTTASATPPLGRRSFIAQSSLLAGTWAASRLTGSPAADSAELPVMDLHVHLSRQLTIEQAVELAERRRVKFGIVQHPGERYGITNDAELRRYIEGLRKFPVHVGLQPTALGWSKAFSPAALAQLDYVLMDPQMVPLPNGGVQRIWEFDTAVDDVDEFMGRYMGYALKVLQTEPIDIFGWPLFLPVCIARDYYNIWTQDRMQVLLAAAKARNIAIEINKMAHVPHDRFISMAKEHGLKFTFGSDARTSVAGHLPYCLEVAKRCGLTRRDFFVPPRKTATS